MLWLGLQQMPMNSLWRGWLPNSPAAGAKTHTQSQAGTALLHGAHLPPQCFGRHTCKAQGYPPACTAPGPRDRFRSGGPAKCFRLAGDIHDRSRTSAASLVRWTPAVPEQGKPFAGVRDSGPSARTPDAAEPSFASTVMDAASSTCASPSSVCREHQLRSSPPRPADSHIARPVQVRRRRAELSDIAAVGGSLQADGAGVKLARPVHGVSQGWQAPLRQAWLAVCLGVPLC